MRPGLPVFFLWPTWNVWTSSSTLGFWGFFGGEGGSKNRLRLHSSKNNVQYLHLSFSHFFFLRPQIDPNFPFQPSLLLVFLSQATLWSDWTVYHPQTLPLPFPLSFQCQCFFLPLLNSPGSMSNMHYTDTKLWNKTKIKIDKYFSKPNNLLIIFDDFWILCNVPILHIQN